MGDDGAGNRYSALIEKVFLDGYSEGENEVAFERTDLSKAASELNIETPKNLGDVVYSARYRTSMPDATPGIVSACALSDEQALLAKIRYNRIVDLFLGIVSYSLQSHLRTSVRGIGQIEIDELYVAIDSEGRQYTVPIQAKGRKDQLPSVQARQDVEQSIRSSRMSA